MMSSCLLHQSQHFPIFLLVLLQCLSLRLLFQKLYFRSHLTLHSYSPKAPSHIPTPPSLTTIPLLFIQTSFLSSHPLPFNCNPSSIHPINISSLVPIPPSSGSSCIHSSIILSSSSTTNLYRIQVHLLHHMVACSKQQCFL